MSVISIKDLSFAYEKQLVLENINLTIEDKDFIAIIGPNGGGKSTLLKLILGINKLQQGSIEVFGKIPSAQLSQIGYVPQNTNINIDFPIKVIETVLMGHVKAKDEKKSFFNKIFNFRYNEFEKSCALEALRQVGMEKFAYNQIGSLSGGQRQRVMIARALCAHPRVLLLDEPTANIDVSGQKQIYELLKQLNKDITIAVVSHDISVILGYANKVAHINKNIVFHNIPQTNNIDNSGEHFCEVEMLQMLGKCKC